MLLVAYFHYITVMNKQKKKLPFKILIKYNKNMIKYLT